jgi:hypothetical protein
MDNRNLKFLDHNSRTNQFFHSLQTISVDVISSPMVESKIDTFFSVKGWTELK